MIISFVAEVTPTNPPEKITIGGPESTVVVPNGFGSNRALRLGNYSPFVFQITGVHDNQQSQYIISPYTMNLYPFDNIRGAITLTPVPLNQDVSTFPPNMHISAEFADDVHDFGGSYPANLGGTSLMTINQGQSVPGAPPPVPVVVGGGVNSEPIPVVITGGGGGGALTKVYQTSLFTPVNLLMGDPGITPMEIIPTESNYYGQLTVNAFVTFSNDNGTAPEDPYHFITECNLVAPPHYIQGYPVEWSDPSQSIGPTYAYTWTSELVHITTLGQAWTIGYALTTDGFSGLDDGHVNVQILEQTFSLNIYDPATIFIV